MINGLFWEAANFGFVISFLKKKNVFIENNIEFQCSDVRNSFDFKNFLHSLFSLFLVIITHCIQLKQ